MHLIRNSRLGFSTRRSQHIGLLGRILAVKKCNVFLCLGCQMAIKIPCFFLQPVTQPYWCVTRWGPRLSCLLGNRSWGQGEGSVCLCECMCMCVNVCLNWTFTTDGGVYEDCHRVDVMLQFDICVRMDDADDDDDAQQ